MANNKVTKRWAMFPKFTDKELVGLALRGKSILDFCDDERHRMLNHGRFVVCWNGPTQPEQADLKLGTLCGVTECGFGRCKIAVRLENGETFRCDNAIVIEAGYLPYIVGARKPGTSDGQEVIGRLIGFVEDYNKNVSGWLRSATDTDCFYTVLKECLAFVSDIKFGL